MLSFFPPECVLAILAYLPIPQLTRLNLVSRSWRDFISAYQSSIYHDAAILHQFAPRGCSLDIAKGVHVSPWLDNVDDWFSLCKSHFNLDAAWTGQHGSTGRIREFTSAEISCKNIKIDEVERTMITTCERGVLQVIAIESAAYLWSIIIPPTTYFEFDNGFIVFGRPDYTLEIWRRSRDHANDPLPATSPDAGQLAQSTAGNPNARGCFVPFTTIRHESTGVFGLFRLVWPTLLIEVAGGTVCVWDLPSATLLRNIETPPTIEPLWVSGVELSRRHVFICSNGQLFVVDPHGRLLLTINENEIRRCYIAEQSHGDLGYSYPIVQTGAPTHLAPPSILTCRVSPDGRDLAAITASGSILYIPRFERAIGGSCKVEDIGYRFIAMHRIRNLSFDGSRIVFSSNGGAFTITLSGHHSVDFDLVTTANDDGFFPSYKNSIQHIPIWTPDMDMSGSGGIEITKTGLWAVYSPRIGTRAKIYYLDFSASGRS